MTPSWHFQELRRGDTSGRTQVIDNFQTEQKNLENIIIREVVQNVLDARSIDPSTNEPVFANISIRCVSRKDGLNFNKMKSMNKDILPHLEAAGHDSSRWENDSFGALVIEESGTSGLIGVTNDSHYSSGEKSQQRWNKFWFGEADESKSGRSLGRRGQGKITYHLASGVSSVFALTTQENADSGLLFGKAIFQQTHVVDDKPYGRHAYFCNPKEVSDDIQPEPVSDHHVINDFKKSFKLNRNSEVSGTSWVIPYVDCAKWNLENLVQAVVSEFYIAICQGSVGFDLDGEYIDRSNISEILDKFKIFKFESDSIHAKWVISSLLNGPKFVEVDQNWFKDSRSAAEGDSIDSKILDKLSEKFRNGETVRFRVPIPIKFKDSKKITVFIEIYLQYKDDLRNTYEQYVRDCLIISEEKHLSRIPGKYFGLMVATESAIVDFLGSAEEASHLKWNQKNPSLANLYKDFQNTLSMVRCSLPSFGLLLSDIAKEETDEVFADFLSIPKPQGTPKKKKKNRVPKPSGPPKKLQPFEVNQKGSKMSIMQGPSFNSLTFPAQITFEFAYDVLGEGNAFKDYSHFDFDFSKTTQMKISAQGCNLISQDLNVLEIEVMDRSFKLEIDGFDDAKVLIKEVF